MSLSSADIMKSEKKVRPGQRGEPILVRLQPEDLALLDKWRRQHEDPPNRPEAIRLLIRALSASQGKKR